MLPDIQGQEISDYGWDASSFQQVLQYYDGPRLLLRKSQAGQLFLGWWNDSDHLAERWVFLPLSESRLHDILGGTITSLEGLKNPEDGYLLVVDLDVDSGTVRQTIMTNAAALPTDSLPLQDARLHIPVPEHVSRLPVRERAHLLDMSLERAPTDDTQRIGAKAVSRVVGDLQRLIDALGRAVIETADSGKKLQGVIALTRLDFVGSYTGSLGLRFETNQEDDMLGDSLIQDSLAALFDLMEVGSDLTGLTSRLIEPRVARRYNDFLQTIDTSLSTTTLSWSRPGHRYRRGITMTNTLAREIMDQMDRANSTRKDLLSFSGTLIAGNIRTLRFEVMASETRERYSGKISEPVIPDMELVPLGSRCEVTIQPHSEVNEATGPR